MDATSDKTDKPKLEELPHGQLVQLLNEALDRLKKANERIETLEKKLNDSLPPKLSVPYSVRSAEARKKRQKDLDRKNKEKKKPLRSGRIKTEEKIANDSTPSKLASESNRNPPKNCGCEIRSLR